MSKYVTFPGTSGNWITSDSLPADRVVGDLDIRCKVALDDWTPTSTQVLLSKWGTQDAFFLRVEGATSQLRLYVNDGSSHNVGSSTGTGVSDGVTAEIRAAWDNAADQVTFYVDGVQLGTVQTLTAGALNPATEPVGIGAHDAGVLGYVAGKIYWAELRDGIDGPIVAHFQANDTPASIPDTTTWEDGDGRTWTANGANLTPGFTASANPDVHRTVGPGRLLKTGG